MKPFKARFFTLLLLVALVPIPFLPNAAAEPVTFTEDFDDEDPFSDPESDDYVFGESVTGSSFVTGAQSVSSPQSYLLDPSASSGTASFDYTQTDVNLCSNGALNFQLRIQDTTASPITIKIKGSTTERAPYFAVAAKGTSRELQLQIFGWRSFDSADTLLTLDTGFVFQTNVWYDVGVFPTCGSNDTDCGGPDDDTCFDASKLTVGINGTFGFELNGDSQASTSEPYWCGNAACTLDGGPMHKLEITSAGGAGVFIDDLEFRGDIEVQIEASYTTSVTNLVGFGMDYDGQTIIARTDGGDWVRTYDASTLGVKGSFETDCSRTDGIFSIGQLVMFIDCDGSTSPDFMRIRTDTLAEAATSLMANKCPNFDDDINLDDPGNGEFGAGDNYQEVGRMEAFPISYAKFGGTGLGGAVCQGRIAWGFSTNTPSNELGVGMFTNYNNADDWANEAKVLFGGQINQICTTNYDSDSDGKTEQYLGAGGPTSNTKMYRVDFTGTATDGTPDDPDEALDATLVEMWTGTGAFGQAIALACSQDTLVLQSQNDNKVHVINWTNGQERWNKALGIPKTRGVAISQNFIGPNLCLPQRNATANKQAVLYLDGSEFTIATSISGDSLGTIEATSGTFKGMATDRCGQKLATGSSSTIAVYNIYNETTNGPTSFGDLDPESGESTEEGNVNLFGGSVPVPAGFTAFGFKLFFAGIIILGTAVTGVTVGAAGTRSLGMSIMLGIVGAIVGVLLAWGMNFLDDKAIFAIIVLVLLAIVSMFAIRG